MLDMKSIGFDFQTLVEDLQADYNQNSDWHTRYPFHTPTLMGVEISVAQELMQYETLSKVEKVGIILSIPIRYLCLYNGHSPTSKECYEIISEVVSEIPNKGPISDVISSNLSSTNTEQLVAIPEMIFKDVQQVAILSVIDDKYHDYKKELEVFYKGYMTDELLLNKLKEIFDNTVFYSLYGSRQYTSLLDDRKKWIKNTIKAHDTKRDEFFMKNLNINEQQLKFFKKKIDRYEKTPDRGIETWFRLASRNMYTRRQILDNKSNILLTINAIVISVNVGTLLPYIGDNFRSSWFFIFPVLALLTTNLCSVYFAIMASRPKEPKVSNAINISNAMKRLMTFDDFHFLTEKSYKSMVEMLLENKDQLYPTIIYDIYALGVELNEKYGLIRKSYDSLLIGTFISIGVLIASVIGFGFFTYVNFIQEFVVSLLR